MAVKHKQTGNWGLLKESELRELIHALGGSPEETSTLTKHGLVAALRTRLLVQKHMGGERAYAGQPALKTSVEAEDGPEALTSRLPRCLSASLSSERAADTRPAFLHSAHMARRWESSTAAPPPNKRPAQQAAQPSRRLMTSDELGAMERQCKLQLRREATRREPEYSMSSTHMEQKLRWYEQSVLDVGNEVDDMVNGAVPSAPAVPLSESRPLAQQLNECAADSVGLSAERRRQETVSLLVGEHNGTHGSNPTLSGNSIANSVSAGQKRHADLATVPLAMELSENFSRVERRLESTANSINETCSLAAAGERVDALFEGSEAGSPPTSTGEPSVLGGGGDAYSATERGYTLDELVSRDKGDAGGIIAWLQGLDGEYFRKFDTDSDGHLTRAELHEAAATYLAQADS